MQAFLATFTYLGLMIIFLHAAALFMDPSFDGLTICEGKSSDITKG